MVTNVLPGLAGLPVMGGPVATSRSNALMICYVQARVYDDKVRDFVKNIGIENIGKRLVNSRDGAVSHTAVSRCSTSPLSDVSV